VFILGGSLFAQQNSHVFKDSEYYYHNVPIERIFAHRLGFIVLYRTGKLQQFARTFIPEEWFREAGGRAELIRLGSGSEWPSMTVFYKDGEFSHVRLRVRRHRGHETWGVVPLSASIDDLFQDIEEVRLEF
jgi:hypothetical protein